MTTRPQQDNVAVFKPTLVPPSTSKHHPSARTTQRGQTIKMKATIAMMCLMLFVFTYGCQALDCYSCYDKCDTITDKTPKINCTVNGQVGCAQRCTKYVYDDGSEVRVDRGCDYYCSPDKGTRKISARAALESPEGEMTTQITSAWCSSDLCNSGVTASYTVATFGLSLLTLVLTSSGFYT